MKNAISLIFILPIVPFWMAMSHIVPLMECIFLNLSDSHECVVSHVDDFHARNKCLTAKLLKQGYRYHKLKKTISKFYQ